ncbi:MAG: ArgE/DapE family deacylase [Geminicoccaceae bacterium]|nr:ArgE/DapE family deacylase [Geminicoccaceae bacterium]
MVDEDLARRLLAAVDDGFEEQVAFLADLVRFPSVRGAEATVQDFIAEAMRARGLVVDRWTVDPDAIRHHPGFSPVAVSYAQTIDVVGTHRPEGPPKGRSLILNGHVDVVPPGPLDMWSSPPFEPRIEAGWMHGRGAGDMKAGVAANLFALDALRRIGLQPAATVHVQSVVEEESTGNGALATLVRGYRADAALITEPTEGRLVRANVGVVWFQVRVRGRPVHVREMGAGANAIEAAYRLVGALKELEARWNAEQGEHPHFAGETHPINLNIGKIVGGDWASSVPAWCTFDARIALFPGKRAADAMKEIEACIADAARRDPFLANQPPEVAFNGFATEGYVLEKGSAAEATLAGAHQTVAGGEALEEYVMPAYLDARVFALYGGMPTLVYGPRSRNIHGFDEAVELETVRRTTKVVALFIAAWCGLEEATPG